MDKRFFKNWVIHIPHRLRDLPWMVRAWYSIAPIFFFFLESTKSNHFLSAHIPWINESHDPGDYHHFCILHFFFYRLKLFSNLRHPRKVWLYGLCILDFHILQLFSQSYLLVSDSFPSRTSEILCFHAWKLSASPRLSSSWCDYSSWNENLNCK